MNGFDPAGALASGAVAAAVLDEAGTVVRWSRAAADLLGHPAAHVCGRPVGDLLADTPGRTHPCAFAADGSPAVGRTRLRHRSGRAVEVAFRIEPLEGSAELLALAAPVAGATEREQGLSLLHALFSQTRMGVTLRDTDLALVRTNITLETLGGSPGADGVHMREVADAASAEAAEAALRRVLETGVPLIGEAQEVHSPHLPGRHRTLSLSAFRLEDARGSPWASSRWSPTSPSSSGPVGTWTCCATPPPGSAAHWTSRAPRRTSSTSLSPLSGTSPGWSWRSPSSRATNRPTCWAAPG